MKNSSRVLESPQLSRRTQRVLALKEKARQAQAGLASILADLGDELIAAKAALKYADWTRWLSSSVKFSIQTAENYMRLSRLRTRIKIDFDSFARLGSTALYAIAALPEALIKKLARDPRLPDPKTGRLTALADMDERALKKALALYRGRRNPPRRPSGPADTREALAHECFAAGTLFLEDLRGVRGGTGKLTSATKLALLDFVDQMREAALHLPAWVTPQKGRR